MLLLAVLASSKGILLPPHPIAVSLLHAHTGMGSGVRLELVSSANALT